MATPWPTLISGDALSGEGASQTLGEGLFDRDRCLIAKRTSWQFDTAPPWSFTEVAATLRDQRYVRMPRFVASTGAMKLNLSIRFLYSSLPAGAHVYLRLDEMDGPTTGTAADGVLDPTHTSLLLTSSVALNTAWIGLIKRFGFYTWISNVTPHVALIRGAPVAGNLFFSD
jgi:hypothetical protein